MWDLLVHYRIFPPPSDRALFHDSWPGEYEIGRVWDSDVSKKLWLQHIQQDSSTATKQDCIGFRHSSQVWNTNS
eukprot:85077-Rhodomonas_salina.1